MATAIGTPYSPPSPPDTSSSATMSPVYPDRPIRPLPRRSLRARLSPEVAEQITLPPAPQSNGMVFNGYKDAIAKRNSATITNVVQEIETLSPNAARETDLEPSSGYRFKGNALESDEEQIELVHRNGEYHLSQGAVPINTYRSANGATRGGEPMSHSIASSNDSIDGYDSFENTNNKKKRKIPTSGSLGSHHASIPNSLSSEMANMGISATRDVGTSLDGSGDGAGQYYGSGSSAVPIAPQGTGISGAGRGRYGRSTRRDISGRSPLGVANSNTTNAWQMGRMQGQRRDNGGAAFGKVSDAPTDHGIISAAIAQAAVLPTTPPKGRENVSLLDSPSSKKSTPANTQFTFTCESDASKGMVWPGDNTQSLHGTYPAGSEQLPPSHIPPNQRGFSTQGTQTSPTMAGQQGQQGAAQASGQQPAQPAPKPRRSAAKRYAMAERQRKLSQQVSNYHHPPREEDIWVCEFCEYESIFGMPPVALVRQYEIKDGRERKRLAEKRRLLEKAKMKGRKGKKGSKNASKSNQAATQSQQTPQNSHAQHPGDPGAPPGHETQSDEYYAEDYEDDPPESVPTHHEVPSKIPRPIPVQHTLGPQVAQTNGT